jgi:hypothetical protein
VRRVLKSYASYHNQIRTHLALDKNAPEFRQAQPVGAIVACLCWADYIITTSESEFSVIIGGSPKVSDG